MSERTDSERLDWLEATGARVEVSIRWSASAVIVGTTQHTAPTLRAAIDKAMDEEPRP